MARYALQGVTRDGSGNVLPDVSIAVVDHGTTTPSKIYVGETGGSVVSTGVVVSDSIGNYIFWIDSNDYSSTSRFDLSFTKPGYTLGTKLGITLIPGNAIFNDSAFTSLTDTPASYTGQGGKTVVVNGTETGLEFSAAGTGTVTSVSSADAYIGVSEASPAPVLTLNVGTGANQIVALDATAKLPAVDGSQLTNLPSGFANPMTAVGDMIVGGTAGAATALAKGTDGEVLTLVSGVPAWEPATGGAAQIVSPVRPTKFMTITTPANITTIINRVRYEDRKIGTTDNGRFSYSVAQMSTADGTQKYVTTNNHVSPPSPPSHYQVMEMVFGGFVAPDDFDPLVAKYAVEMCAEHQALNATTAYTSANGHALFLPYGWVPSTVYQSGVADNYGTYREDRPMATGNLDFIDSAWLWGESQGFDPAWVIWYDTYRVQLLAAMEYFWTSHFGTDPLYNPTTKLFRQWSLYRMVCYYYADAFGIPESSDLPAMSVWGWECCLRLAQMEEKAGRSATEISLWSGRAADLREGINAAFIRDDRPMKYFHVQDFHSYPSGSGIPAGFTNQYSPASFNTGITTRNGQQRFYLEGVGGATIIGKDFTVGTHGTTFRHLPTEVRFKIRLSQNNKEVDFSITTSDSKTLDYFRFSPGGKIECYYTGTWHDFPTPTTYNANQDYDIVIKNNISTGTATVYVDGTSIGAYTMHDAPYSGGITRFDFISYDGGYMETWDWAFGDTIDITVADGGPQGWLPLSTGPTGRIPSPSWSARAASIGCLDSDNAARLSRFLCTLYNQGKATGSGVYEYPLFQKATGMMGHQQILTPTPWHERHCVSAMRDVLVAGFNYGTHENGGYMGAGGEVLDTSFTMALTDPITANAYYNRCVNDVAGTAGYPDQYIRMNGTTSGAVSKYNITLWSIAGAGRV